MNNEDRILQLLTDMQQDISSLKQSMSSFEGRMSSFEGRMSSYEDSIQSFNDRMSSFEDRFDEQKLIILNVENNLERRINALYDGHMLNKEKHDLLEHRADAVDLRVARLEIAAG